MFSVDAMDDQTTDLRIFVKHYSTMFVLGVQSLGWLLTIHLIFLYSTLSLQV